MVINHADPTKPKQHRQITAVKQDSEIESKDSMAFVQKGTKNATWFDYGEKDTIK